MAVTVITITNAPSALRGDLTKWMQEIATGVYIGNFNAKIRENLWERVKNNIGKGEATLSYHSNNELGYRFETYQNRRKVIDYDGIPLVLFPICESENISNNIKYGFSKAYKQRNVKKYCRKSQSKKNNKELQFVILDIETDGLDVNVNKIIEIGLIKDKGNTIEELEMLINIDREIPNKIKKLTGITKDMLELEGVTMETAMDNMLNFVEDLPIIGYSVNFDISFINKKLSDIGKERIKNKTHDLLKYIKNDNLFLENYRLETVLKKYGINEKVEHRALSDAKQIYQLAKKVNGFLEKILSSVEN